MCSLSLFRYVDLNIRRGEDDAQPFGEALSALLGRLVRTLADLGTKARVLDDRQLGVVKVALEPKLLKLGPN